MPIPVLDMKSPDGYSDGVLRAVEALAAGKVVAVPTETVYGLAALATNAGAVERLLAAKDRPAGCPLALAISSAESALDYAPGMSPLAKRLTRRCWPGPVTLVVEHGPVEESLVSRLPETVRSVVSPEQTVGMRVVAHHAVQDILHYLAGPLVLSSANRSGEPDATTAQQVAEGLGDSIDLILDNGTSRYGQPSTVVRVGACNQGSDILREGVVGTSTIDRLSLPMILMVCTGNTCRSPMAEVLMRKHLADKLGCTFEEVEERGAIIASAGIAAGPGGRPSEGSVEALRELGLSLNGHLSQPMTDSLAHHADLILTMTRGHRDAIVNRWPAAAERTELLRQDQRDISDPIGGSLEQYKSCADQMNQDLKARAENIEL